MGIEIHLSTPLCSWNKSTQLDVLPFVIPFRIILVVHKTFQPYSLYVFGYKSSDIWLYPNVLGQYQATNKTKSTNSMIFAESRLTSNLFFNLESSTQQSRVKNRFKAQTVQTKKHFMYQHQSINAICNVVFSI